MRWPGIGELTEGPSGASDTGSDTGGELEERGSFGKSLTFNVIFISTFFLLFSMWTYQQILTQRLLTEEQESFGDSQPRPRSLPKIPVINSQWGFLTYIAGGSNQGKKESSQPLMLLTVESNLVRCSNVQMVGVKKWTLSDILTKHMCGACITEVRFPTGGWRNLA